jgi:predicted Zn-dependent protease
MAGSGAELFKDAMASLNAGRPDNAERHFKALLRLQPINIAAFNILGAVLASQHKYAEAERICVRASHQYDIGQHLLQLRRRPEGALTAGGGLAAIR